MHNKKGRKAVLASRRKFLKAGAGLSAAVLAYGATPGCGQALLSENQPVIVVKSDPVKAALNVLTWDTEGGDRVATNLLRQPIFLKIVLLGETYSSNLIDAVQETTAKRTVFHITVETGCEIVWTVDRDVSNLSMSLWATGPNAVDIQSAELIFPWDLQVTPTTIISKHWIPGGSAATPIVISAPDFGQVLLKSSIAETSARFTGSRTDLTAGLVLELPEMSTGKRHDLSFIPLQLPAPAGLEDRVLWKSIRRSWFNCWQPTASWGDATSSHSSPGAVLGNNVVSDVVSFSLFLYADHALWVHSLTPDISVMESVRDTLDWWLDSRTQPNGQVIGYWDYDTFLDSNASILISAWDYVEATSNLDWLVSRIDQLALVAERLAECDVDDDGLCEATQSGNSGTLFQPQRSSNWFDGVNFGYKDGYSNALIYRAWRCMADLFLRAGRTTSRIRCTTLADRLRSAYAKNLWNPATGWLGCWKSEDGALHDYISPVVNGMAIEYGLVSELEGRQILNGVWKQIHEVGFTRFDFGVPSVLLPVRADDYIQPDGFGSPKSSDGRDTFQQYENGGITAAQTSHFLAAHYVSGIPDSADSVLRAMIARQIYGGGFQNGVQDQFPKGKDWTTWSGVACGYEGYLADNFVFLQAVLLREARFRNRYYRPLQI